MALNDNRMPYGLRDVKVATLDAAGAKGTLVDLPNAQTFEFQETTSTQELRGDDAIKASRTSVDAVEWTLEAGGINFEAMKVMAGGTITVTGTAPDITKKTWSRKEGESYPDFFVEGQAMSETGGDHHTVVYRAKANQISGSHQDQEFWVSHAEGTGIGSLDPANLGAVWDMVGNDAETPIA